MKRRNGKSAQAATLERCAFSTSRLADFCSKKELTNQTGHAPKEWPQVIVKETLDNALDACEEEGVQPIIDVVVDESGISVSDNGLGIPPETIVQILDFTRTVSSRRAYASPTRGAQGNALKTLIAMPHALSQDERGTVCIGSRGLVHDVDFTVDQLRQQPKIDHRQHEQNVKGGTFIKVQWPDSACSILRNATGHILQIVEDYAVLNPHLSVTVECFGQRREFAATMENWEKWMPHHPTSPHWYNAESFKDLLGAQITNDAEREQSRLISDFISEFDGLKGSQKRSKVLDTTRLARKHLSDLVHDDTLKADAVSGLLAAMQKATKPVQPKKLGIIGKQHLGQRFEEMGCVMESFDYCKALEFDEGLPYVLEIAFAWRGDKSPNQRRLITGVNWSPGIGDPFRSFGAAQGDGLAALLESQRAGPYEPVVFFVNFVSPCVRYLDRGKTSIFISSPSNRRSVA